MPRLDMNDIGWMSDLLTQAFLGEPPFTHLFPGQRHGDRVAYFMRSSCSYALQFGQCHATPDRKGVALWLVPGATAMTLGRMYKAGMLSAPFRMAPGAFLRFGRFAGHTGKMHESVAPMPHYYLFALGVHPSMRGKGIGGQLIAPMLARADRENLPVYLETQNQRNVGFYRRLGFAETHEAQFPNLDGLVNWGMLRPATA